MSDRINPPSWTEWTRNPNERTPHRKLFDELAGELRKEGLIEAKASLFVHLARYSYLHVKNAVVDLKAFLGSVPESVFGTMPPNYRMAEVEAVVKILETAGLLRHLDQPGTVLLTERQAATEVARGQVVHALLSHLRDVLARSNTASLVTKPSSFPTPESVVKATGTDPELLVPGDLCVAVQDRPDSNETNPNPFLQATIEKVAAPVLLLQFWPLPDPKGESAAPADPEFTLLFPGEVTLESLVRNHCIPLLEEFFRNSQHQDEAAGIQAKYASYMHKYRERFAAAGMPPSERIDKVLGTADPDGEAFATAVYVVVQVFRRTTNPIVYQAARIAWARAMALRVHKRKSEKEAATRQQDTGLLVTRLKESARLLTLDDLKRTPDGTRKKEIGSKYATLTDLLPLQPAKEGQRPLVYEIRGHFVHRENLIRAFLDLREREALAQQERLAQLWARQGIPSVETIFLADKDVSAPFFRAWELVHQERLMSPTLADFVAEFLPPDQDTGDLVRWLWPDGKKLSASASEVVNRGLDPVLYEDRDRLRRRSLAGVLGLPLAYPVIVKAAWDLIFMEEGLFRFVLRKFLAMFGQKPKSRAAGKKGGASAGVGSGGGGGPANSGAPGSNGVGGNAALDARARKVAELNRLKELVPLASDRAAIAGEREKTAGQWCFKLDPEANRRTRQAVDDEVGRWAGKIALEQLTEENAPKVALFLIEKSEALSEITSSRAFHRYLYLTALQKRTDLLSR